MKGLNMLNIDDEAVVAQVREGNRRLEDLGLVEGTKIKCVLKSPLGDPAAYRIRGSIIAIRSESAEKILVEVQGCE